MKTNELIISPAAPRAPHQGQRFVGTTRVALLRAVALIAVTVTLRCPLQAQPSAFTYQGRLQTDGADAGGDYDFQCDLFASAGGGAALTSQTVTGVPVKGGLFALSLDYGAAVWPGADRWLELRVRPAGGGSYTTLTPRQRLTSTPYSIRALEAGTAGAVAPASVTAAGLAGGAVTTAKILDGTITPADLSPALLGGTFWRLDGNGGTVPGVNFLGTTDGQPLEIRASNERAFLLQATPGGPNVVGGSRFNSVDSGAQGGTIAGGLYNTNRSSYGSIGGGFLNRASGPSSRVGGGARNTAGGDLAGVGGGFANLADGRFSTVGGGAANDATGTQSTVSGGLNNESSGTGAAVGGGEENASGGLNAVVAGGYRNEAGGDAGVIGGGEVNAIRPSAVHSFIGGGWHNTIWSNLSGALIGGGWRNTIETNASFATIAGGADNRITNRFGTIAGGEANVAGGYWTMFSTPGPLGTHATVGGGRSNRAHRGFVTIAGGDRNSAMAYGSAISGGSGNIIHGVPTPDSGTNCCEGAYNAIGGGLGNVIWNQLFSPFRQLSLATIGGGGDNQVFGYGGTISGGYSNRVSLFGAVVGGQQNQAGYASVAGGENNSANDGYSVAFGQGATDRLPFSETLGRMFAVPGDGQAAHYVLTGYTTGNIATNLPGPPVPLSGAIAFTALVSAKCFGNFSGAFEIKGLIRNYGAVVDIVGTPIVTILARDNGSITASVTAASGGLSVRVQGPPNVNTRWVASLRTSEVVF
jgi:hypothetical protein